MTQISYADDTIEVDAGVLAKAFRIDADTLKRDMRSGAITSLFERGEDGDAGKVRLTFFSASRRVRITADTEGKVLTCSALDFGKLPLPASARRP
ncbi:DUF6522 family protein [Hoeflea sp. G2-23]|uniref:DUF6522 family protein n=1 Tax=Hoeflea algicola TaxID=2983763 RepID=A0ABT3Z7N3_9HYPH|nr:DUF6522 family protein [Hoeflea algicola]MCY0147789.1 DUF6522 family protein [Hoeflea algicola]